jgi:predicted ArsR family transcriptional regulator
MDMPASGAVEMTPQEEAGRSAESASNIAGGIERVTSSIARLTSSSIEELEGLSAELQELQKFLNAEVQRVQAEIDSALAGIKIIVETIAPFKAGRISQPSASSPRTARPGITTWPKA